MSNRAESVSVTAGHFVLGPRVPPLLSSAVLKTRDSPQLLYLCYSQTIESERAIPAHCFNGWHQARIVQGLVVSCMAK